MNGIRYVTGNMKNSILFLRIVSGMHTGASLTVSWIRCIPDEDSFTVPSLNRFEFLVCDFFAVTKNKAQGNYLGKKLGIDLRENCISHGQVYVALLSANHTSNIVILCEKDYQKRKNILYPKVHSNNLLRLCGTLPSHFGMLYHLVLSRLPSEKLWWMKETICIAIQFWCNLYHYSTQLEP